MPKIFTWFFSFSLSVGLGLSLLATMPAPAVAITSTCVEGCMTLWTDDINGCKSWLEPGNVDENAYGDCLGAAASHATQCLGGCSGGGGALISLPGGNYNLYAQGQTVLLAAGLKVDGSYIHDPGPVLYAQARIISYDDYYADTTLTFLGKNWSSAGLMTYDGDSLWTVPVSMGALPSLSGYFIRYDFVGGPTDTTLMWVSTLMPQPATIGVGEGLNPTSLRLSFTPNPTRDQTHINFYLPSSGPAEVTLYDLAGRRLRSWKWRSMSAGQHAVAWDWTLESGQRLASSVVFCRLTVHGQTISHSMTRLK